VFKFFLLQFVGRYLMACFSYAGMSEQAMKEAYITPGLVRLAVGIEHADDLIADLDQAMKNI